MIDTDYFMKLCDLRDEAIKEGFEDMAKYIQEAILEGSFELCRQEVIREGIEKIERGVNRIC